MSVKVLVSGSYSPGRYLKARLALCLADIVELGTEVGPTGNR